MNETAKILLKLRFVKYIKKMPGDNGCWRWKGPKNRKGGYGQMTVESSTMGAHRVSWILHRGPLLPGMCVVHLCRLQDCVNPDHLVMKERRVCKSLI